MPSPSATGLLGIKRHIDTEWRLQDRPVVGGYFSVQDFSLDFKDVQLLAQNIHQQGSMLKRVCLQNVVFKEKQGLELLLRALQSSPVTSLEFRQTDLGQEGAWVLAQYIKDFRQLECLSLAGNRFGLEGAVTLIYGLANSQMRELDFSDNDLGNNEAHVLATILPSTNVRILQLYNNRIGDAGVAALAKALSTSMLQNLSLWMNPISIKGFQMLLANVENSCLQNLHVLSSNPEQSRVWAQIDAFLESRRAQTYVLQVDHDGNTLTFRTLGGDISAVLALSQDLTVHTLPSSIIAQMRARGIDTRRVSEKNLRIVLPRGNVLDRNSKSDLPRQLSGLALDLEDHKASAVYEVLNKIYRDSAGAATRRISSQHDGHRRLRTRDA